MIEKKIYSDFPEEQQNPSGNEGLLKNFQEKKEEPPPLEEEIPDKKEDAPLVTEEKSLPDTETENISLPKDHSDNSDLQLTHFLLEVFGSEAFDRLRKDGNFVIPFTDSETSLETWLNQSMRMLFKPEETEKMKAALHLWLDQQNKKSQAEAEEIEKMHQKLEEKQAYLKQMENDFQQIDAERKTLKRDLLTSVSAVHYLDVFLPKGKSVISDKISTMLKEEMSNPTPDFPAFIIGFTDGWTRFTAVYEKAEDNEPGMEEVHLALTGLLEKISGCSVMQRRPILELIAGLCTSKFKLYKFISPEESLQVDPRIHAATALGGSTIKEGISFAVIRKDTMQTLKYAEIKV